MKNIKSAISAITLGIASHASAQAIDNSAIGQPQFREHKATYGVVYRLPKDVTDVLRSEERRVGKECRL